MKAIQFLTDFSDQMFADREVASVTPSQLPARWWVLYVESLALATCSLFYFNQSPWLHCALSMLLSVGLFVCLVRMLKRSPKWLAASIRAASGLLLLQLLLPLLVIAAVLVGHALGFGWTDTCYHRLISIFS